MEYSSGENRCFFTFSNITTAGATVALLEATAAGRPGRFYRALTQE